MTTPAHGSLQSPKRAGKLSAWIVDRFSLFAASVVAAPVAQAYFLWKGDYRQPPWIFCAVAMMLWLVLLAG